MFVAHKEKPRKRERSSSSSSSSSSSMPSSELLATQTPTHVPTKSSKSKKAKRKLKKKMKKKLKKEKRKLKKELKKQKKKLKKAEKASKKLKSNDQSEPGPMDSVISQVVAERSKAMTPMTQEEWEKQQSVVRRVYDEETGRHRLIKGDGEVMEEIVSRERHHEINKQATRGDGIFFQSKLSSSSQK